MTTIIGRNTVIETTDKDGNWVPVTKGADMSLSTKWMDHIQTSNSDKLYAEVNDAAREVFMSGVTQDGAAVIRAAILAERERCAAIAEAWASDGGWHCDIAEKIRGGAEPNKNPEFSPVPPKDWSGA